jgi:hypothetical protein
VAAVLLLAAPSRADLTFTFLENGSNVTLGNSSTFNEGAFSLSAQSVSNVSFSGIPNNVNLNNYTLSTGGSNQLYAKNGGSGETGLGLTSDSSQEHEITYGKGILLNFTNAGQKPYTIDFGSVQSSSNDVGILFSVNTTNRTGSQVGTLQTSDTAITITSGSSVSFLVTEYASPTYWDSNPNILLGAVTVTTTAVPEPVSVIMALCGLPVLGLMWGRHRRRQT